MFKDVSRRVCSAILCWGLYGLDILGVEVLEYRDVTAALENQMENKIKNEMEIENM